MLASLGISSCSKLRVYLRRTSASKVFQLDQHRQRALKLAVQMRFVARKLFQPIGLQPLAKGLVDDGAMVAGLFFLLVDKGGDMLADECCQPRGIGGVCRA